MKIDINKKYRTRDGRAAVVHTTSGPRENHPVVASIEDFSAEGGWKSASFTDTGRMFFDRPENPLDLIEVREPREFWVTFPKDCNQSSQGIAYKHSIGEVPEHREMIRVREIID